MAIYHYSAQVISRSQGRSAVAAIAYRTGTKLTDDRTGLIHDYTKKRGIAHVEILAPANAPEWVYHREILWNQVEAAEKRKDSQVAFEVNLALPVELTEDQNIKLLRAFIQQQFVDKGFIADFAIHLDDPQNPHAHILRSTRPLDGDHFGKKPKAENWLTRKESLQLERIAWADQVNQALEKAGSDSRIDYR
ncbi:MAG: MobA/MobL family protein, partial [Leptolyngbyaceae cyanobacterium CAN_BIN12]|nr:MobA/MobL family protein [Leptolyngbyaceae cyanobacterium CAN_BIN12]